MVTLCIQRFGVIRSNLEISLDVPERGDLVQATTDGLQVWSVLTPFSPATLKDCPQFINESKACRCPRLIRSIASQYCAVDFIRPQITIWFFSAKYLAHTLNDIKREGVFMGTNLVDDHSESVAIRLFRWPRIWVPQPAGIEKLWTHPPRAPSTSK